MLSMYGVLINKLCKVRTFAAKLRDVIANRNLNELSNDCNNSRQSRHYLFAKRSWHDTISKILSIPPLPPTKIQRRLSPSSYRIWAFSGLTSIGNRFDNTCCSVCAGLWPQAWFSVIKSHCNDRIPSFCHAFSNHSFNRRIPCSIQQRREIIQLSTHAWLEKSPHICSPISWAYSEAVDGAEHSHDPVTRKIVHRGNDDPVSVRKATVRCVTNVLRFSFGVRWLSCGSHRCILSIGEHDMPWLAAFYIRSIATTSNRWHNNAFRIAIALNWSSMKVGHVLLCDPKEVHGAGYESFQHCEMKLRSKTDLKIQY